MKILWATGFNRIYYDWIFSKVKLNWKSLPGDVKFYIDDNIPELEYDPRAVPSGIDPATCPLILTRKESKFWKKAQCIIRAVHDAREQKYDYVIWLDADITVTSPPRLDTLLPGPDDIISVNHKTVPVTSESRIDLGMDTGFLAVNVNHSRLAEWLDQYTAIWNTDEMLTFKHKYDTYTLDRVLNKYGYQWKNLWTGTNTHGKRYCGFEDSDLEYYFLHHWGNRNKENIKEEKMNSWLEIFKENYYELLGLTVSPDKKAHKRNLQDGLFQRADGFLFMFSALEQQQKDQYHIIETGTMRNPGNWRDGQSSFLFTEFVQHHGGSVRSVDINPEAVDIANNAINSSYFHVTCSDSVTWLQSLSHLLNSIDFFYLDSYDLKWINDQDSAEHHLQEFLTIEPHLKSGAIVAIDDNSRFRDSGLRTGKGRRIVEYLESKNIHPVYDHYQIIYYF